MTKIQNLNQQVAIRDAATVAVLRDGPRGDLEVLLLRRNKALVFAGGADVFPGGALGTADGEWLHAPCVRGAQLADARWRMAVLRECFEEAGLLFDAEDGVRDAERIAAERHALNAGERDWLTVIESLGTTLDLAPLVALSSWTTPPGFPKRYATRFYALAAPTDQVARPDGEEVTSAEWVAPAAALAEAKAGQRRLMTPTRATLNLLARFDDTVGALAGLAREAADD